MHRQSLNIRAKALNSYASHFASLNLEFPHSQSRNNHPCLPCHRRVGESQVHILHNTLYAGNYFAKLKYYVYLLFIPYLILKIILGVWCYQ